MPGSRFNDSHWSSNQGASDGFKSGQGHPLASSDMKKADVVSHFPLPWLGPLPLMSMPRLCEMAQDVQKLESMHHVACSSQWSRFHLLTSLESHRPRS